jgi:hypothetical protein
MGTSQENPQFAVGRNGKLRFGDDSPTFGFFLPDVVYPQDAPQLL